MHSADQVPAMQGIRRHVLCVMQAERPEDDPDVRGGGRAAEDARIVKGADYASDEEEPLRNEVRFCFCRLAVVDVVLCPTPCRCTLMAFPAPAMGNFVSRQ